MLLAEQLGRAEQSAMTAQRYPGIDKLVAGTIESIGVPASTEAVVQALASRGISHGQVRNALWRLKKSGQILSTRRNREALYFSASSGPSASSAATSSEAVPKRAL